MKKIFLLIIISLSFLASGQIIYFNYLDYSVKFRQFDYIDNLAFTYTNISNGYIYGDTIINGKQYYKQYINVSSSIPSNNGNAIKFIREDNNLKFYTYNPNNNTENMDYDWAQYLPLTVGTVFPSTPTAVNNCSVTAIDSILLGTRYLKRWHGPLSSSTSTNVATTYPSFIVEGIGLITGGNICYAPLHSSFFLSCYSKQGSVLSFSVNGNCAGVNALEIKENKVSANNVILFPNPAKDILNIKISSQDIANLKLSIFDQYGELIKAGEIIFKNEIASVNLNELANGIYHLNLRCNESINISKRFFISK